MEHKIEISLFNDTYKRLIALTNRDNAEDEENDTPESWLENYIESWINIEYERGMWMNVYRFLSKTFNQPPPFFEVENFGHIVHVYYNGEAIYLDDGVYHEDYLISLDDILEELEKE